MTETWVDAYGLPRFEVSDCGNIRRKSDKRLMKLNLGKNGYLRFTDSTLKKTVNVHRLVLCSFHGNSALECNHKDGVKSNNCLGNLEFVTVSQNALHRVRVLGKHNLQPHYGDDNPARKNPPKGEKHPRAKLSDVAVLKIKELLGKDITKKRIAEDFGVTPSLITRIATGKAWSHLCMIPR